MHSSPPGTSVSMKTVPDSSWDIFVSVLEKAPSMAGVRAVFIVSILLLCHRLNSDLAQEKRALLAFVSRIPHEQRFRWNPNSPSSPCDWFGVRCDPAGSAVRSLRLPGIGLAGRIPPNTVGNLSNLRVLSLRSNRLAGEIPPDLAGLGLLRSLYLQDNEFSGKFPVSLTRLTRLTRLDLFSNKLTGDVPSAVNNLTRLTGLFLENNGFSRSLPSINLAGLRDFNVSNNKLNGSVPETLARFERSSFQGNPGLCGPPLLPNNCKSFFPRPAPSPPRSPTSKSTSNETMPRAAIIAIPVGSALALFLLLLFCRLRRRHESQQLPDKAPKPAETRSSSAAAVDGDPTSEAAEGEWNKLVFREVGGGGCGFDLEDLLRASAEILGKGSAGTSYKAVLEDGTTVVVVKRLRDVAVSKREFEVQMEAIGRVKHANVAPLRAFYYSQDEKLLVSDYMVAGSLSALLHGSRGPRRTALDWDSRMRIAVTAARGLSHLHVAGKLLHANLKSSNVLLLRPYNDAVLSDFALHPLFSSPSTAAGYLAPELTGSRRPTPKSDVYGFGVLLLELLTGRAPNQGAAAAPQREKEEEGFDLPRWVQLVVREEWTAEVFDKELLRDGDIEEEMVRVLQVAMACVSEAPEQRPSMVEVLRMVEEVSHGGGEDEGVVG